MNPTSHKTSFGNEGKIERHFQIKENKTFVTRPTLEEILQTVMIFSTFMAVQKQYAFSRNRTLNCGVFPC